MGASHWGKDVKIMLNKMDVLQLSVGAVHA